MWVHCSLCRGDVIKIGGVSSMSDATTAEVWETHYRCATYLFEHMPPETVARHVHVDSRSADRWKNSHRGYLIV